MFCDLIFNSQFVFICIWISGVVKVMINNARNKLKVIGIDVDPWDVRERVEAKIHREVEFVSPANPPRREVKESRKKRAAASERVVSVEVSH